MKFSLKTMLFVICGVGALLGIMGRLLIESPEEFLWVMNLFSTVVPFVLAGGMIVWIGLRSRQVPYADAPSNTSRRRWDLAIWGVALLLMPVVVQIALTVIAPTRNPLQLLSTERLIRNRLPKQIDEPWVWNELVNRMNRQGLTQGDVDEALRQLIAYMKQSHPAGWDQPLAWQHDFVRSAVQAKLVSNDVFLYLCDTFFGMKPKAQLLAPVREGKSRVHLSIEYGSHWSNESGLGVDLNWYVKCVLLDGIPIAEQQSNVSLYNWSAWFDGLFKAGEHELTFEIVCGYFDQGRLPVPNTTAAQWPPARKRWTTTVAIPLKVEPLELGSSAKKDPIRKRLEEGESPILLCGLRKIGTVQDCPAFYPWALCFAHESARF